MRTFSLLLTLGLVPAFGALVCAAEKSTPPNIVWITSEDISPDLGCYGVEHAVTPTLDRLATEGVLYENAFALAGVCAVSRSCIITGMYSSSIGSQGMRFHTRLPAHIKCFTEYLQQAGYYCTNRSKTDYNFSYPKSAWDQCDGKAHWRGRAADQPFFAVFNFTTTHESQIRCPPNRYEAHMKRVPQEQRHNPAATPIPPFHPDTPEAHRDWAQYHDLITAMDLQVNDILQQLEEDGLADDTIVFYYSDHGAGMPRCKKSSYDTGTRIPLIIRFPEKYAHLAPSQAGTRTDRLVSFVDFAPTALSLIDLPVPKHMQGVAFLGKQAGEPREYVYNIRDRMAERPEFIRGVHDKRYLYLRNYRPDLAYGRYATYTQQMPTTQVWMRLAAEAKLTGPPAIWFEKTKPIEELYDTQADPWNIKNLAEDPVHADALKRLRAEHLRWMRETRDLGFLPEHDMLVRSEDSTPFEMGRSDEEYPLEKIYQLASLVGKGQEHVGAFTEAIDNSDAAIRYWGAIGFGSLGKTANASEELLVDTLKDSSPSVKLAAAMALIRIGSKYDVLPTAVEELKHESEWVRLDAVLVIEKLGDAGRPALPHIQAALKMKSQFGYDHRLLKVLAEDFSTEE